MPGLRLLLGHSLYVYASLRFPPCPIGRNVDTLLLTYSRAEKGSDPHNALRTVLRLGVVRVREMGSSSSLSVEVCVRSGFLLHYIVRFRISIRKVPPLGTTHYVENMSLFLGSNLSDGFFDYTLFGYFLRCKMLGVWFEMIKKQVFKYLAQYDFIDY